MRLPAGWYRFKSKLRNLIRRKTKGKRDEGYASWYVFVQLGGLLLFNTQSDAAALNCIGAIVLLTASYLCLARDSQEWPKLVEAIKAASLESLKYDAGGAALVLCWWKPVKEFVQQNHRLTTIVLAVCFALFVGVTCLAAFVPVLRKRCSSLLTPAFMRRAKLTAMASYAGQYVALLDRGVTVADLKALPLGVAVTFSLILFWNYSFDEFKSDSTTAADSWLHRQTAKLRQRLLPETSRSTTTRYNSISS